MLDDDTLTVSLTTMERLEALHGDVSVPRSSVVGVHTVDDVMDEVRGWRGPGTGVPSTLMIGTLHYHGAKTFAVCHGHHRGVVIDLSGQDFERLLISVENADEVVAQLR